MKYKKRMNALSVFGLLCCFAFVVSACGNSETDTTPKADTASNIETESNMETENRIVEQNEAEYTYLRSSTVEDVISDPCFEDFGRLLFPVDRSVSENMTLEEISSGSIYAWYNYIDPDKTVEIIQSLHDHAAAGEQIFYKIYSEEEKEADPSKEDTGLFFFRGNPGEKFAVVNAGGGFMYVGAM